MSLFGNGTDVIPIPKFIYALRIWEQNKFVDFKEHAAGPELTCSIEAGYYLPDEAAEHFITAMNCASSGASGASADYSVSYNRAIDKFTISRTASGASSYPDNAFDLLFDTGTNAASGAGTGFGYDVSADATGASSYEADNMLPNRIVSSRPIRRPRPRFDGMNREGTSESGIFTSRHVRTDIFFQFMLDYIPENELKDEWALFMGKVDGVESPWARKNDFEFYPKATASGDYIVFHPQDGTWEPEEQLGEQLPAFYRWTMQMREVIPKAGTLSLIDIYTRTPG